MDELSSFKFAPAELRTLEGQLLEKADVVFTGGYSLYEAKKNQHSNIHPFPSSIDFKHFSQARELLDQPADQASIPYPRFGFYGVIDERMNLQLIEEIATLKEDWQIILIGPVAKIDEKDLPRLDNIHYLGMKNYDELPTYLSSWDVAIMPFAINESTRFISPTKTPEYLAAGLPVISTPIQDVVRHYSSIVEFASNSEEFIAAGEKVLVHSSVWLGKVDKILSDNSWDRTWEEMQKLIYKAMDHSENTGSSKNENLYV